MHWNLTILKKISNSINNKRDKHYKYILLNPLESEIRIEISQCSINSNNPMDCVIPMTENCFFLNLSKR